MPFVTIIQNPDSPVKHNLIRLENLCKEAWVAMRQHSDTGPFEAIAVGGLVDDTSERSTDCLLMFYYAERFGRGMAFRVALLGELKKRLPDSIIPIPVPTEYWFTDPVWAVKEVVREVEVDSGAFDDDIPF